MLNLFLFSSAQQTISKFKAIKIWLLAIAFLSPTLNAFAQNASVSEEDVASVFSSGGYGALFGGAMGAAILPFINKSPTENIRLIAGGASIGFMIGTFFGFYNLSNNRNNSYFNYNNLNQDEDNYDNNYYYSMPPTYPTEGLNSQPNSENQPMIGALFMKKGSQMGFSIPDFWIGEKSVGLFLADLDF
jgi:hypothetical protein